MLDVVHHYYFHMNDLKNSERKEMRISSYVLSESERGEQETGRSEKSGWSGLNE